MATSEPLDRFDSTPRGSRPPRRGRPGGSNVRPPVLGGLIALGIVLIIIVVFIVLSRRAQPEAAEPTVAPATLATSPAGVTGGAPTRPTQSTQPTPPPQPATPVPTAVVLPTPTVFRSTQVIGQSAGGRSIEAILVGTGDKPVVFVGALQGAIAPNTRDLVQQAADFFSANPDQIPSDVLAIFVPALNPDGLTAGNRPNSRGVYLGNNWDIRWSANPHTPEGVKTGGGGAEPFSEPESVALRDLVVQRSAQVVIFYQAPARGGLVIPGEGLGEATSTASLPMGKLLSDVTGFRMIRTWADRTITGDPSDWMDREGIMSAIVLLPDRANADWARQREGMLAAMQFISTA